MDDVTALGVTLTERGKFNMVQVSAWPATSEAVLGILTQVLGVRPPDQPNAVVNRGQIRILWLGPNRWLIVGPAASGRDMALDLAERLDSDTAAVVDLSAGRCLFALSGPAVRDVLAKCLPLDLSPSKFAVGRCMQSAIAHMGVLVHAEDKDAFEVFVYRGFAQHLWEILADATLSRAAEAN